MTVLMAASGRMLPSDVVPCAALLGSVRYCHIPRTLNFKHYPF